ncbi:MAG: SIS domain-containing protein [Sulfolobales archaeon]
MIKEIHEQPLVAQKILSASEEIYKKASDMILRSDKVLIIGSGSSYHAGLLIDLLMKKIPLLSYAFISSEYENAIDLVDSRSTVIAISQSGFTSDTLEAVKKFRERGCSLIAVTNVIDSPLAKLSDHTIYIEAGVEEAVTATKSFTGQVLSLLRVYLEIIKALGRDYSILERDLQRTPHVMKNHINLSEIQIRGLVDLIYTKSNMYVLGRGLNYAIALESALKLKEACSIHAEALSLSEVRHGPKTVVDESFAVGMILGSEKDLQIATRVIEEIKDSNAHIVVVAPENLSDRFSESGLISTIRVSTVSSDIINSLLNLIVFQQLAYYTAISRLLDPDYPKRLGKIVF